MRPRTLRGRLIAAAALAVVLAVVFFAVCARLFVVHQLYASLDTSTRTAQRGGRPVDLTARESALLELLLRNARVVVLRERAIEEIWREAAVPNVVDRYVARLRRKLGEPPLIHTVRGVGFMLRT